ncbi:MAG: amino acid ABC transporter permease [Rhodobacteraceae bacterium]|nr:amino acid ABC transporter permease [Paracoccaceae bacterium]
MAQVAYVRHKMLPEQTPPPNSVGTIGWLRTNLFSGWFNTLLTIVAVLLIFRLLANVLPWALVPTWGGTSLGNCREILQEMGREGHFAGACWGVIRERWLQLFFGFYPSEIYWRPILAFFGLFVALSPILFPEHAFRLIGFSAIYPFIVVYLIWGGSIWGPVMALLGFVIGYMVLKFLTEPLGRLAATIAAFLLPVLWWLFLASPIAGTFANVLPLALQPVESAKVGGFMLAFIIGVTGIAASLPIGIVLALGRRSDLIILKGICVGFIEFIRGVPLITLLFVASTLLNIFMPPGTKFDLVLRVTIMVTLFSSAYMAEVIRGGLAALSKGQYEAADSLGLDYWQSQRLIIMPQALKISIPGIVGNFIGLFKDTTLVSVIALWDPILLSTNIRADTNWNGILWELYGFIAVVFFITCFSMSRYSMYLERKLATDHR